jgi:hypothetical protein
MSPEQQWRAEMAATMARIEDMLKRLLDQALLPQQPTGRGLGH